MAFERSVDLRQSERSVVLHEPLHRAGDGVTLGPGDGLAFALAILAANDHLRTISSFPSK